MGENAAILNYARYGTYYLQQLTQMETLNPGLKKLLMAKGMSVQAQTNHPVRTSVDQRGEQTINKDAKTSGISLKRLNMFCRFLKMSYLINLGGLNFAVQAIREI